MTQPARGFEDRHVPRAPRPVKLGQGGGFATLGSGVAVVDVAANFIQSYHLIHVTPAPASFSAIASNQGGICVRSINPGVGFQIGTYTGVAYPWDTQIHWLLHDTRSS